MRNLVIRFLKYRHMVRIKAIFILLWIVIWTCACDRHYSSDRIIEAPTIDNEFYNIALAHLNNSIENYPNNPDNYYKKALVLETFGNYEMALLEAKRATTLKANDADYLYLLAKLYALDNNPNLAIATAQDAIKAGASESMLYGLMADMYYVSDSLQLALDYIEKALDENKESQTYRYTKGKIHLAMGDTVMAERELLRSLEGGGENKETYLVLSDINMAKQRYELAGQYLNEILNTTYDTEVLYSKGAILNRVNMPDSAKGVFVEILRHDEKYAPAYYQLGQYYYGKNNLDSANWYAEEALKIAPKFIDPMLLQARILDRRRQYQNAVEMYESILALEPANITAAGELRSLKGKILYLQRLQEERRARETQPVPLLTPIF